MQDNLQEWRITTQPGGGFVPWRRGHALPRRWTTTLENAHLPYRVVLDFTADEDGPNCRAMRLEAREQERISSDGVRHIPIRECIRYAVGSAAAREQHRSDGSVAYDFKAPAVTEFRGLARHRHVSEKERLAHLEDVARAYLAATDGKPTRAVWEHFNFEPSYSTVARWVGQARKEGLFDKLGKEQNQ